MEKDIYYLTLKDDYGSNIEVELNKINTTTIWSDHIVTNLIIVETNKTQSELESLPFVEKVEPERVNGVFC